VVYRDPSGYRLSDPADPEHDPTIPLPSPPGYNPEAWIVGTIREQREVIREAAERHHLQPNFLAAVLYLENGSQLEQTAQSLPAVEAAQQSGKFLWNRAFLDRALRGEYKHFPGREGKKYEYFKIGRSQGIGAIKPEVAQYLLSQGSVLNPFTGEQAAIPPSLIPHSLVPEEWSIEYLAAHLETARNPKDPVVLWPGSVPKSDYSSENALRLMVTYHHNVDNLVGWNNPNHPAHGAATAVIQWMPYMDKLLEE